jgi:hypothetical protein
MAPTSGTFAFAPPFADVIIAAYGRCQIRRPAITVEHLIDAAMAANLLQVDWSNEQVNLWTVDKQTINLTPFVDTYDVDPTTVMIMSAWITTGSEPCAWAPPGPPQPGAAPRDRILTSVDRDTYAAYPDKVSPARPTVYWFNLTRAPTITLWQPPDDAEPYVLHFFRARQMQDASVPGGLGPETPYRFMEAYVAGLAFKLAELYAPGRMTELAARAIGAFDKAKNRDVENAQLRIVPAMGIYTSSVYG